MELPCAMSEVVSNDDLRAFAAVFDQYHSRICRYLCSLTNDYGLAEDLAQDTFLKAYKALGQGANPTNLKAWLYAIATNTALSALRRRRLIAWLPLPEREGERPPISGDGLGSATAERELIGKVLRRLPRDDAACLLLRFQEDLPYEEIAETLGVSAAAAKMRVSRARAAFRDLYLKTSREGE